MGARHLVPAFLLAGLLAATGFAAPPPLSTRPALTFFSTISEEPLARLEADSVGPRFVKHGPFEMPAPGVAIEAPSLTLHDQPCTGDDWARLLQEISRWQSTAARIQLFITLPDGTAFVFQRPPSAASGMLSGLVRPLNPEKGKSADTRLLRVSHDGKERLQIDLRPLPSAASGKNYLTPAEPEPDSATPLPSEQSAPSEPSASP